MESERAYHINSSMGINPAQAMGDDLEPGVAAQACDVLGYADTVHGMLDDLEARLFGPEPRAVPGESSGQSIAKPSLASAVKGSRQRLSHAADRLSRILGRL